MKLNYPYHGSEIAIIGMAGRFPAADSVDEYWQNLCLQREGIRFFSADELASVGVSNSLLQDPSYVKAKGVVRECNDFDAAFFNYNDREAGLMDPQLRLYHECAWHALEDAGYAGKKNNQYLIGVFGGASANALWTAQYADVAEQGGAAAYEVINVISRDFFNSRLAYKLDLKGPAITVQTACSTALVAVHQACQSLLSGDSDIALAGAVSLSLNPTLDAPEQQGYLYQEGMILSPDGHCRPFDQNAQGTVLSDGVGFVVLKRLQDAIADGDRIHAVIKGSAINNDGNEKVGYTAPSVNGQREVIEAALMISDVDAATVGYIEAHGTGTHLGDPIEVQALMQAYKGFEHSPCYLGSVKSNLGHLDTAAGIAGLIKAVSAVKHGVIPATLHFNQLNSKCDLASTKLQIAESNQEWKSIYPLRAGVSSFGIGGTNVHLIIEEYVDPAHQPQGSAVPVVGDSSLFVLPLSAKTEPSLVAYQQQLQQWLPTGQRMADVAHTLIERRAEFDVRQAVVTDAKGNTKFVSGIGQRKVQPQQYWMFSGQGAQYLQMGKGLYDAEAVFRATMDECLSLIAQHNGPDLRPFLFCQDTSDILEQQLRDTEIAQLALFVVEYSLAKLFSAYGLQPKGLIGHSLGEYVAACFANVFSLPDAIKVIIARGRLMAKTAAGSMVAVHQSLQTIDLSPWVGLSVAATNTEDSFVVSGAAAVVEKFTQFLVDSTISHTPLRTSHAFHSALMDPILSEFASVVESVKRNPPLIPIVSNVTGDWVSPEQMTRVDYWVSHLRQQVCFHQGIGKILRDEHAVFIEVGPGKTLYSFVRQHAARQDQQVVFNSLRSVKEAELDLLGPRRVLAELYAQGVAIDWSFCHASLGKPCSLPGYAFDKKTYIPKFKGFQSVAVPNSAEGFYQEHWVRHDAENLLEKEAVTEGAVALVLRMGTDDELPLIQQLTDAGLQIISVTSGLAFQRMSSAHYQLRPEVAEDYVLLAQELARAAVSPSRIIGLWQATHEDAQYHPFAALLLLVKAFSQSGFNDPLAIYAIAAGAYRVAGDETLNARAALVYGAVRVIGQEYSHIRCHLLDVRQESVLGSARLLADAVCSKSLPLVTAYRGNSIWTREFALMGEEWNAKAVRQGLKANGVYIITGGFGGLGSELARYLAKEYKARLVLCSRQDKSSHALLSEIRALGGDVITSVLDIRDTGAVKTLLDAAVSAFGCVNGIIHAAGAPGETMIQRHQLQKAIDVVATKFVPAVDMVALTREYNLDLVVFFSSVTGILGGVGQADYCAANAGLDALAEQARSQGLTQVYSIRWDAWRETGMAVDALNGKLNVLSATTHPFLGDIIRKTDSDVVFRKEVTVDTCWPLSEHWVMGVPTIPGTTYLEMAGAAFSQYTGQAVKQFEHVYFLAPCSLAVDEKADLYTQLTRDGNLFNFEVGSYHRTRQQWLVHARGQISPLPFSLPAAPIVIATLQQQYQSRYLSGIQGAAHLGLLAMGVDLSQEQQDAMMKYGERWAVVKEVWVGFQQALARLTLASEFASDFSELSLHPAILDCALSYLRAFLDGGVYIPISYQSLAQYHALPATLYSHVKLTSPLDPQTGAMSFDIQLLSEEGKLLADIKEFTMRRIDADFANASATSRTQSIPKYVRQFKEMSQGLTSARGLAALEQVVRSSSATVLLAASDFGKRYLHADEGDMGLFDVDSSVAQPMRARPGISVEYVAPKTPQQKQIAEIWQQMLGYDSVGIQDDFFELGGDSLLLMQIHKKIQTQFEINIAVVELYNYPTIQRLTEFLLSQETNQVDAVLVGVSDRIEKQKAAANRRKRARQD